MSNEASATRSQSRTHVRDMAYIALFAAVMAVCSWISIQLPISEVPYTLQTMGVVLAVGLLGGKRGTVAVLVYILLGAVGLPVFAGFSGGLGTLFGMTGGYIIGFLFTALLMWGMEKLFGTHPVALGVSMVLGLAVCYAFGTGWFMVVYANSVGPIGLMAALGLCVFPYLAFDAVKIAAALIVSARLRRYVPQ